MELTDNGNGFDPLIKAGSGDGTGGSPTLAAPYPQLARRNLGDDRRHRRRDGRLPSDGGDGDVRNAGLRRVALRSG